MTEEGMVIQSSGPVMEAFGGEEGGDRESESELEEEMVSVEL